MAKEAGFQEKDCEILVAHLFTENGALSEHRDGDDGCSLGMIQWNFCVHEKMKARKWVALHPEWGDWRFQVQFYLSEITRRKNKYDSLTVAIESWNFGARPHYIQKVRSNIAVAKSFIY